MQYELGIIGAGNMAEAIARGVTSRNVLSAAQIVAADVSPARRELFDRQLGIRAVQNGVDAARDSKMILLSVKPQQMRDALGGIGAVLPSDALVISIAAGISTALIETGLGKGTWRVIRTMPNTPMLVGEGMVAISGGRHATADDLARARRLFEPAATVIEVPEEQLDAVTALSGSGPAYFFFLVEQMIAAGVEMGLSEDQARLLASKTVLGAAKMLATVPDSPEELRRKVTSPGGTTEAAIRFMEAENFPAIVRNALHAAQRRSRELLAK